MSFKVKKIRKTKHLKYKRTAKAAVKRHASKLKSNLRFKHIVMVVSGLIILLLVLALFKVAMFLKELSFKDITLALLNRPTITDEENHTNILLLGHGGENHDGANLTDTIIIASVDFTDKKVGMLSLPRDLWVENEVVGGARINKIVELSLEEGHTVEEGIKLLEEEVEEVTGIEIHYYAQVDFKGFEKVIDDIGGVTVNVPETLYDPFYPKDGTYEYEPFYIKEGIQELDGETALKYARSRKTTSDFDRSRRQKDILKAVKEKLTSSEVLLSKTKLKELYNIYSETVTTDLQIFEFIYLGRQGVEFDSSQIGFSGINDDPYTIGGFLYTPEREYFGGAYVLLPRIDDFEEIKEFAKLTLYSPEILIEKAPIHMLNGTKTPNLAGDTLIYLERYGFDIVRYGNSEEKIESTQIYVRNNAYPGTVQELEKRFDTKAIDATGTDYDPNVFSTQADIVIVLGQDIAEFKENESQLFY